MDRKHRKGPITYSMKATHGAEINPLNFYSTSYSTNFGIEGFNPKTTRHLGTGYVSNLRPGVYYSESLDNVDNVPMMKICRESYVTTNQKHFRPSCDSNGKDELPARVIDRKSGFTEPDLTTIPDCKTVYQVRADQIDQDEKDKPYLHKIQLKRVPPIDKGSLGLITHNYVDFEKPDNGWLPDLKKDVGNIEPTGYVSNISKLEPIQHFPTEAFRDGVNKDKRTQHTMNQETFLNYDWPSGKEANKGVSKGSNRDDGYTINQKIKPRYITYYDEKLETKLDQIQTQEAQWTKKNDPAEYINFQEGSEAKTMSQALHNKKDFHFKPELFDSVGKQKELSGFSINHLPYNESKTAKENFLTNYEMKYLNVPKLSRYINNGDTDKLPDGFTRDIRKHQYGDGKSFRESQLESLIPFASRRIKVEHPCYTDMFKNYKWSS